MNDDIYIIGSGGFAKEVYFLLKRSTNFKLKGFVDINSTNSHVNFNGESYPIIDEDFFIKNYKGSNVCVGIGNPKIIRMIQKKYSDFNFPNIIDNSVIFDDVNIKMGVGNIITPGCILTTCIEIGNLNIFNLNTTVGHDTIIGDCNVFNPCVNISGNCKIGNNNLLGVCSVILERKTIGNNSILGANSTLIDNIGDNSVFVGSPAKFKKNN